MDAALSGGGGKGTELPWVMQCATNVEPSGCTTPLEVVRARRTAHCMGGWEYLLAGGLQRDRRWVCVRDMTAVMMTTNPSISSRRG